MTEGGATIGHTAVKVKDIIGMIKMMEDLLGFHVSRKKGDGGIPSDVWFEEGLQLVNDPDFAGPEGRLHHLGIFVSDRDALAQECKRRGFSEVRPNWYALPDGLVLEFLSK
jgi:lactoylglutathione lyase